MASIQTVSATSNVASTPATAAADTTPSTSSTSTTQAKSFTELFADAKKDLAKGEKLKQVKGHEYAQYQGGKHDAQYVNLSGNARSGEVFDLVTRNGRMFHVYEGDAGKKTVVEIKAASSAKDTGGTTAPKS
jgi:hypothetical protein